MVEAQFAHAQGKSQKGGTAFVQGVVIPCVRGWKAGFGMGNGLEPVLPWPQQPNHDHENPTAQNHRTALARRTGTPRTLDAM